MRPLTLVLLVALAACAPAGGPVDPARLRAEIQARDEAWSVANIAGDSAAMAGFYTTDVVSMQPGAADLHGRDAVVGGMVEWMRTRSDTILSIRTVITSLAGTDSLAWESGETTFEGRPKNEPTAAPRHAYFKYTTFWRREADGIWRIQRDLAVPALAPVTP